MDSLTVDSHNQTLLQRQLDDLGFHCVLISPIHSKYRKIVCRESNVQIPL